MGTVVDEGAFFDKYSYGYLTIAGSSLLFYINNYWLMRYYTPEIVKSNAKREWKWRNITNSLIHSFITGVGACLCFWWTPEMREDLVNPINLVSHNLVSFSIGYFIYDLIDMAVNDRKSKTYELLLHHFMVILCFMTAMSGRTYQGYTLMALLVEVNSIFLHIRQLMILTDVPKLSVPYRVNNSLNMGTFVVFRVLTLGWMSRWLIRHRNDVTPFDFYLGAVVVHALADNFGMGIVADVSIFAAVFYRIHMIGTFVVFRILTLGWMSRWLIHHRYDTPPFILYLCATSLTVIMVMNTTLLNRLLNSDYWQIPKPPTTPTQTEKHLKAR